MSGTSGIVRRIAVGKLIGLIFGLTGFFLIPEMNPQTDLMLQVGFLFWYITLGAIIGFVGLFDHHPIFKFPMPWWLRGPCVGAWLNLLITLIAYDKMQQIMMAFSGPDGTFVSPFWLVAEGALVGLIIGFFATRYGGEGLEIAKA